MVANATATTSVTVNTHTRSVTVTDAVTEDGRMANRVMTRATVAEVTPNVAAFTYSTLHDACVLQQIRIEAVGTNEIAVRSPMVAEALAGAAITHRRGDSWRYGNSRLMKQ